MLRAEGRSVHGLTHNQLALLVPRIRHRGVISSCEGMPGTAG